jgi:hypothetical protein
MQLFPRDRLYFNVGLLDIDGLRVFCNNIDVLNEIGSVFHTKIISHIL